jgi:hypothetical protein
MAAIHHRLVNIGEFPLTLPDGRRVVRLQKLFSPSSLQTLTYGGKTYTADSYGTFYVPEDVATFLLTHATGKGQWLLGPANYTDEPIVETKVAPKPVTSRKRSSSTKRSTS